MNRSDALPYLAVILDDAQNVRAYSASAVLTQHQLSPKAILIGWQCTLVPMFVAVQSYLPDTQVGVDEAVAIAVDYLKEKQWFAPSDDPSSAEPDYVLLPDGYPILFQAGVQP